MDQEFLDQEESLRQDEGGAMMLVGLFMAMFLVGVLYFLMGLGDAVLTRTRLQDTADAGAFGLAVLNSRGMNLMVLMNLLMALVISVYLTLRALEILMVIGLAITNGINAACFGCASGIVAVMHQWHTQVSSAANAYESAARKSITTISKAQHNVADYWPDGAFAYSTYLMNTAKSFRPPKLSNGKRAQLGGIAVGAGRLPMADHHFSETCARGVPFVKTLVGIPLAPIGRIPIIGGRIVKYAKNTIAGLAKFQAAVYCGMPIPDVSLPTIPVDDPSPSDDLAMSCASGCIQTIMTGDYTPVPECDGIEDMGAEDAANARNAVCNRHNARIPNAPRTEDIEVPEVKNADDFGSLVVSGSEGITDCDGLRCLDCQKETLANGSDDKGLDCSDVANKDSECCQPIPCTTCGCDDGSCAEPGGCGTARNPTACRDYASAAADKNECLHPKARLIRYLAEDRWRVYYQQEGALGECKISNVVPSAEEHRQADMHNPNFQEEKGKRGLCKGHGVSLNARYQVLCNQNSGRFDDTTLDGAGFIAADDTAAGDCTLLPKGRDNAIQEFIHRKGDVKKSMAFEQAPVEIYGCTRTRDVKIVPPELGEVAIGADGSVNDFRPPMGVPFSKSLFPEAEDVTWLGEAEFQSRSVVVSEDFFLGRGRAGVKLGSDSEPKDSFALNLAGALGMLKGNISFAQAEFFWNGDATGKPEDKIAERDDQMKRVVKGRGPLEWNWDMRWRARLRRFHFDDRSLKGACDKFPDVCKSLQMMGNAVSH